MPRAEEWTLSVCLSASLSVRGTARDVHEFGCRSLRLSGGVVDFPFPAGGVVWTRLCGFLYLYAQTCALGLWSLIPVLQLSIDCLEIQTEVGGCFVFFFFFAQTVFSWAGGGRSCGARGGFSSPSPPPEVRAEAPSPVRASPAPPPCARPSPRCRRAP